MAINFFDPGCSSSTSEELFGILDVPPAAYDFSDSDKWIAWVENDKRIVVDMVAVDQCLDIPHVEGERCEAILTYSDAILFLELKDRDGGRWAGKSRDQLTNTIKLFNGDAGLAGYTRLYGHIANKQRPNFKSGGSSFSQKFERETSFILRVDIFIKID